MTVHPDLSRIASRDQGAPLKTAVLFMLGASALVAATSLIAKFLSLDAGGAAGLHPFQVSAGRFVFAFVALGVFVTLVPSQRVGFAGVPWRLYAVRVGCGWSGVTALFAAVAHMPVAEATAISFLSPLITIALAALTLQEKVGLRKILAGGLALAGAALILKPGTDAFVAAGMFALAAAAFMGVEAIFIKKLSDREAPVRILILSNGIGSILAVITASFVWAPPVPFQWAGLAALGAVMVCGQAMFIQSLKRADASSVIPVFYAVLVFAALFDLVLYGVVPDAVAIVGASLIVGGALWIARQ